MWQPPGNWGRLSVMTPGCSNQSCCWLHLPAWRGSLLRWIHWASAVIQKRRRVHHHWMLTEGLRLVLLGAAQRWILKKKIKRINLDQHGMSLRSFWLLSEVCKKSLFEMLHHQQKTPVFLVIIAWYILDIFPTRWELMSFETKFRNDKR